MSPLKIKLIPGILGGILLSASAIPVVIVNNSYAEAPRPDFDDNAKMCIVDSYNSENGTSVTNIEDVDFDKITEINCENRDIEEINGIASLTNLKILNLGNNKIESIDLSKNTELYDVDLKNNNIVSVYFGDLELVSVDLTNNNLSTLWLPKTRSLMSLYVSGNPLEYLDISGNLLLRDLEVETDENEELEIITPAFAKKNGDTITMDVSDLGFLTYTRQRIENAGWNANDFLASYDKENNLITIDSIRTSIENVKFLYTAGTLSANVKISTNMNNASFIPSVNGNNLAPVRMGVKKYFGETLDSDDYLERIKEVVKSWEKGSMDIYDYEYDNLELTEVEIVAGGKQGVKGDIKTLTDEDLRKIIKIEGYDNSIVVYYRFNDKTEESPKSPDTGFFMNEDGGLNVSNTFLVLAGISSLGFAILFIRNRLVRRSEARKF